MKTGSKKRGGVDKVHGLHLWAVTITNALESYLWITTRNESISAAITKAERFMRQDRDTYSDSRIKKVKYRGTIDA